MGTFKKFALGVFCLSAIGILGAAVVKYNAYLVNVPGVSANTTYPLPLNSYGIDFISFVSIASSDTFANETFSDGQVSTGSVTVTTTTAASLQNLSYNGINVSFMPSFGVGGTSTTATSIVNGINSNPFLNTIIVATNNTTGSVIITTSTMVGAFTNYIITSSSDTVFTIGGATKTVTGLNGASIGQMWGGKDASYTLFNGSTTAINITNNTFTLALPVLYTSAQAITGLTTGTTYFVIPLTANAISLAKTSTAAVAGIAIPLTSSQTKTTADTFTLAALAITGTPSYKWEVSNDGLNWIPYTVNDQGVAVASVSLAAYTSTGTITSWDFGEIQYSWIRLNVTGPTQGAIKLIVAGNGKNSSN